MHREETAADYRREIEAVTEELLELVTEAGEISLGELVEKVMRLGELVGGDARE